MRALTQSHAARIASGATTFAHVWMVTRKDGAVFGFTDHDAALTFQGVLCSAASGLTLGAIEKRTGLGIDTAAIEGVLDDEAITAEDLAAGAWDGARVEIYQVDWANAANFVHLFAGRLGEVRETAAGLAAELRGLTAALNIALGRTFSRLCDAEVGDARCGVALGAPAFSGAGFVTATQGGSAIDATGLSGFADGWFTGGVLVTAAGKRLRCTSHRNLGAAAALEYSGAHTFSVGAGFVVFAGCDRRFDTCRGKFQNAANFRGFPHIPGSDSISAGPPIGQVMDGSKR